MSPLAQPLLHSNNGVRNHSPTPKPRPHKISDPIPLSQHPSQDPLDAPPPDVSESLSVAVGPPKNGQTASTARPDSSRRVTSSNPLNSVISHTPQTSVSTIMSKDLVNHRRRGSTLRTVMRRIFGRKRGSGPVPMTSEQRNAVRISQWTPTIQPVEHPIEAGPASLRSRSNRAPSLPARTSSLPQSPTDSPLEDLGMPRLPRSNNGSPRLDHRQLRRRATLPSIVLSTQEARELALHIALPTSRPRSIHSPPQCVSHPVGFPQKTSKHQKRRSRSVSGLREAARSHRMSPIQWRRRSDEIKLLRESFLRSDGSPSVLTRSETRSSIASVLETADGADDADDGKSIDDPFNFSTLMGSMQDSSDTNLAQRVNMLEVKLMDLEFAIAKLQGHDVSPVKQPFDKSMRRHSPYQKDTDAPRFISSFQSSPSITPPRTSPSTDRPSSTVTLRPQTSCHHVSCQTLSTSVSDFKGISVEQYSALTTLMRREQTARKLLEEQIFQLQRDVAFLNSAQPPMAHGSFFLPSYSDSSERISPRNRRCSDRRGSQSTEPDGGDVFTDAHQRKIDDAYRRVNIGPLERYHHLAGMI
ncbi:hypothetical protein GX48_06777 [Paracoccidioides brasiliensis]|nr:hypothetical protein GX48_06777 [Paracoccidioides brasiliensis]